MAQVNADIAAMGVTVVCAAVGTVIIRGCALRLAAVKPPHAQVPAHVAPIPCLGGLAICVAAGVGLVVAGHRLPASILVGTLLFLVAGVVDDLRDLSVPRKALLQIGCALVPVSLGLTWHLTGSAPLDNALTVLWILLVVNALNLTDVCDGLVGGLSIVSLIGIAAIDATSAPVCIVLAMACVGFLPFNIPKATIFLGESGTASLGFLLASLSVGFAAEAPSGVRALAAALIVAVPLFELVFLVVVRSRNGLRWWHESADHVALRLQAAGNSTWHTDVLMWLAAVAMAVAGRLLVVTGGTGRLVVGLLVAAGVGVSAWLLVTRAPAAPAPRYG